ncbi:MAG TPA: choice-of-anchor X domain-containing protein, partial [Candidatus Angelobacter sp.]|nr:choice-of-anchor X domain-containing protein [Candidatus Angelobacter sp.]
MYTVTVGPSSNVEAAINQNLANHTLGFYLNTEDTPRLLSPFFLELLQNVLKFNSYETVRMISKTTSAASPFSATVPISTSSHDAEFTLTWPANFGSLRLTVTPPGGGQPLVKDGASGFISIVQILPPNGPFDPRGDWGIRVEALNASASPVAVSRGTIPFDLHIMTDDGAIKSDLSIVPADYKPGDKIKLRAKLTQFGRPIVGLGSKPRDQIEAELVRPGQSIGDLLSDSDASATPQPCPPTGPCDKQSPAEAKLANMLKDPTVLGRQTVAPIQLFDDGKPEHGDDVAGDGIYSALYLADQPGHYNFLIGAERTEPGGPRFSRQQLRTAYVRPFPDGGNTDFQTSIVSKGTLQIIMTPRGKFNDRLGPGWANYFWFTAPGATPFKAHDNLNGTYTATLNFTGSKPPQVSVHFEDVIAIIGDSITPDLLPQPLNSNNVLVSNIPVLSRWAAFLDLGGAFPHSTFRNSFNPGFDLNAGLEYMSTGHFSVEGIFGYHHFPAKSGGDLNVYQ